MGVDAGVGGWAERIPPRTRERSRRNTRRTEKPRFHTANKPSKNRLNSEAPRRTTNVVSALPVSGRTDHDGVGFERTVAFAARDTKGSIA